MRITDIFLSIPPLVLALSIMAFLKPTLTNAMIAVSMMWWPWYTRLIYNLTRSLKNEGFVISSKIVGASHFHIIFREILPNCSASLLPKLLWTWVCNINWILIKFSWPRCSTTNT